MKMRSFPGAKCMHWVIITRAIISTCIIIHVHGMYICADHAGPERASTLHLEDLKEMVYRSLHFVTHCK